MKKIGNNQNNHTLHLIKHLKLELFLNAATVKGSVPGCRKGSLIESVSIAFADTWISNL